MKATGITRNLDQLGRIVLPIELRRTLDINENDSLEIFTEDDTIILRKYNPGCYICGGLDELAVIDGKRFCRDCMRKIAMSVKRGGPNDQR